MKIMASAGMKVVLLLGLWPLAASAAEAPKAPAASANPSAPAVQASTPTAKPRIDDFFTGMKKRSPYAMPSGGSRSTSGTQQEFDIEELDANQFIRQLYLKGLLRDKNGAMALLVDSASENGLILRGGKLYDYKNNLIKGVLGEINMAQKTVKLTSPDKEVRILRLGEEEGSDEE